MRQKAAALPAKARAVERIASEVFIVDAVRCPALALNDSVVWSLRQPVPIDDDLLSIDTRSLMEKYVA